MRGIETGGGQGTRSRRPKPAPHASVPSRPQVLAPAKTGVFARPRPSAPNLGRGQAAQRVAKARQDIARRTTVGVVPKVAGATDRQRQAAKELAVKTLGAQGIHTRADVAALPARERRRANRLLGYAGTLQKHQDVRVARRAGATARTQRELAAIGQQLAGAGAVPAAATRGDKRLKVGVGPFQLATINLGAARRGILGATSLGADSAENAWVRNTLKDVAAIGSAPVVGGLQVARAAYDASPVGVHDFKLWEPYTKRPDTARAKQLGAGVVEGIKEDAAFKLLTGHPREAQEAFREHPGFTALDIAAAFGIAGRGAGAAARGAGSSAGARGARGALARAGSRVRSPIALLDEPGSPIVRREASGDLIRKGVQTLADRTRRPLLDREGNPVRVVDRGRTVTVLRPRSGGEANRLAKRRADFLASRANAAERLAREVEPAKVMAEPGRVGGRGERVGKRGQQVISKVVEGVLRPGAHFVPDLDKRIGHLERQLLDHDRAPAGKSPYHHSDEVKQARDELAALKSVRSSPRALKQVTQIVTQGQRQGRELNRLEREARRLGTLEDGARRAALQPYAISHMGARHVTVEEHGRMEAAAMQRERAARAHVDAQPKGSPARAAALADWRKARRARIETSGRDPRAVHAHEALQGDARRARNQHRKAADKLRQAREQRARVVGRHLANRDDSVAAARLAKLRVVADRKVERALAAERAARARRVETEKQLGASKVPKAKAALRDKDGRFLPDKAIEAHMRQHGVDPDAVAFLSHRDLGNGAYHARMDVNTRPNLGATERRTGAAHVRGSSGYGPEQVRDEAARKATRNTKAEQVDQVLIS